MWKELKSNTVSLLVEAWTILKQYRFLYILFLILSAITTVVLFNYDKSISTTVTTDYFNRFWWFYAGELSHYGAFERGSLLLLVIILVCGIIKKRPDWRRAVVACLLACLFAGVLVNIGKSTTGRPRPNSGVEQDGFYGPTLDNDYKSFPSAHSTTSLATATSLAIVFPAASIPLFVFESSVAFSRIYVKGHYPADVVAGSAIGIFFGSLFGMACRRLNKRSTLPY